jgi:hypothetical protein
MVFAARSGTGPPRRPPHPNHVVEQALAHTIGNAVEAAYRRGDLFEKRRQLMNDWAAVCARPAADSLVALRRVTQWRRTS